METWDRIIPSQATDCSWNAHGVVNRSSLDQFVYWSLADLFPVPTLLRDSRGIRQPRINPQPGAVLAGNDFPTQ